MIEINVFIKNPEKITKMLGIDANKAVVGGMKFAMKNSLRDLGHYIAFKKLRGQVLKKREGLLSSSIQLSGAQGKVTTVGDSMIGTLGTNMEYAAVQEYGGTIRPKHGKYLAIPITRKYGGQALTDRGRSRGRPRDFKDTFFAVSKKGNLIMFGKYNGKVVPLFAMKKEVKIPKRPYMKPSLQEKAGDIIKFFSEDIQKHIEKIWR